MHQHSCLLLIFMVAVYIWHAVFELMDESLEKWFKKYPWLKHGVLRIGAMLLLAPAVYYAGELLNTLDPALISTPLA